MPNRFLWTALRPIQLFTRLQLPFLVGILVIPTAMLLAVDSFGPTAVLLSGWLFLSSRRSCSFFHRRRGC